MSTTDNKTKSKNIRTMSLLILVVLSLFCFYFLMSYMISVNLEKTESDTESTIVDNRFDRIFLYIHELYKEGESNIEVPKNNIANAIKEHFTVEDFEKGYKNLSFDSELYNIIRNNIEGITLNNVDNSKNGVLVLSNYGVVEDYNYTRSDNKKPRYFTSEMENTYNKELYEDAIFKIQNHSDGIICIEDEPHDNPNHIKIKHASYDTIKEVYIKEGLDGLKNYQFFVPLYITDTGDIFGIPDIESGKKIDNYKFIIIQEFNLVDQINTNHSEIKNFDKLNGIIKSGFDNVSILLKLLGIFNVIMFVTLLIFFIMFYNNFIVKHLKEFDEQQKNNTDNKL